MEITVGSLESVRGPINPSTSGMRSLGALLIALSCSAVTNAADVVEYYHLDPIGNVRLITDQDGDIVERHDYYPFGEECTTGPCAANPGVGAGHLRKFTGKERDAETGLDYFGARYYGAKIGRFTTVDPVYTWNENLLDPQRWNRYAYVRNNPLRYTDPDGRVIDTVVDVVSIGYDIFDIGRSVYRGEAVSGTQIGALGADALGAAIPFATGGGAALRAAAKAERAAAILKVNKAVGKAAEARVAQEVVAEGQTILSSQVCCRTSLGRRVSDHVVQDAAGNVTAIEVKSGNATRSAVQRAKDAEIAAGQGTFVGKNAPAELRGQQRAVETIERKPRE
jgi:RHS repeat-associated protein